MKEKFFYYLPLVPIVGFIYILLIAYRIIAIPKSDTFVDTLEVPSTRTNIYSWYQSISICAPIFTLMVYLIIKSK